MTTRLAGALGALILPAAALSAWTGWAEPAASAGAKDLAGSGPQRATPPAAEAEGATFAIGDRLSIRVFERYLPEDGTALLSSLMEYPEISGEFVVGEDGTIFLPILGELRVAGETQTSLRAAVSERFSRDQGSEIEFVVKILEREPVYVTGSVASPGAYRHVPGMTVLHAVTLAGGSPGSGGDAWRRFEIGRERERLRLAELTLGRLYAENAVLEAEVTEREPTAPEELGNLVGRIRSAELVAEAHALRRVERERMQVEEAAQAEIVAALEREATVLREALVEAETATAARADRLESLSVLHGRGLANNDRHDTADDALVAARERWNELRMSLARVERALAEVRQEHRRLVVDDHLERERERADLRKQIADYQATHRMLRQMLLGAADPGLFEDPGAVEIVVLRRGPDGLAEVELDRRDELVPGDLVEVRAAPEAGEVVGSSSMVPDDGEVVGTHSAMPEQGEVVGSRSAMPEQGEVVGSHLARPETARPPIAGGGDDYETLAADLSDLVLDLRGIDP